MFSSLYFQYYFLGIILIPGIIFAIYAQAKTRSTFNKYNKIKTNIGYTGKDIAEKILDEEDIKNVKVIKIQGFLSDHYSHKDKVIALSPAVYDGISLSSLGVAAHEVGHAIQYKKRYFPVYLRSLLVPTTNIINSLLWPIVLIGILFGFGSTGTTAFNNIFIVSGLVFFSASVVFSLVTLPVEINASKRARIVLEETYMLSDEELRGSSKVLSAAALTYIAALLISVLNLVRFIILTNRD